MKNKDEANGFWLCNVMFALCFFIPSNDLKN
jgi:hypothetical protein